MTGIYDVQNKCPFLVLPPIVAHTIGRAAFVPCTVTPLLARVCLVHSRVQGKLSEYHGYNKFQGAEVDLLTCHTSVSLSDRNKRNTMVEDLVVRVRGGASEYITALAYKDLPTADLMQEWGDAVQYNPDIIKIKVQLASCSTHPDLYSENSCERLP